MQDHTAPKRDATVTPIGVSGEGKVGRVAARGVARTGKKRRGKHEHEALRGHEFNVDGRLMKKERVFDRKNNTYIERVVDVDSGEVVRDVQEPLSDHTGHGSEKLKRSQKKKI